VGHSVHHPPEQCSAPSVVRQQSSRTGFACIAASTTGCREDQCLTQMQIPMRIWVSYRFRCPFLAAPPILRFMASLLAWARVIACALSCSMILLACIPSERSSAFFHSRDLGMTSTLYTRFHRPDCLHRTFNWRLCNRHPSLWRFCNASLQRRLPVSGARCIFHAFSLFCFLVCRHLYLPGTTTRPAGA